MRFRCDREELLGAVQAVSGVVAGKGVHPVYESVSIVAGADSLTFTATDLEIVLTLRLATG
jgi:DNA polymerase III sliding clamp (beta) subunit (PCNA family)